MDLPIALRTVPLFTPADAARAGIGPDAVRGLLRASDIRRIARGWYTARPVGGPDLEHVLRSEAARRATGRPLTAVSALLRHGLPSFDVQNRAVTLVRSGEVSRSRKGYRLVAPLPGGPRLVPGGRWVDVAEALAATALDDPEAGLVGADAALRVGAVTRGELDGEVRRIGARRHGIGAVRALELADGRRESVGESRLAWLLAGWGFDVVPQHPVRLGSRTVYPDFWVVGTRVLIEFDGAAKYVDHAALVAEKEREDALRRLGWVVVRVVWKDLYQPARLRARLDAALAGC